MSFVVTDSDFLPDSTSLLQGLGKKPQISTESRGEMSLSSLAVVCTDQDLWYVVKAGAVLLSVKVNMVTSRDY